MQESSILRARVLYVIEDKRPFPNSLITRWGGDRSLATPCMSVQDSLLPLGPCSWQISANPGKCMPLWVTSMMGVTNVSVERHSEVLDMPTFLTFFFSFINNLKLISHYFWDPVRSFWLDHLEFGWSQDSNIMEGEIFSICPKIRDSKISYVKNELRE